MASGMASGRSCTSPSTDLAKAEPEAKPGLDLGYASIILRLEHVVLKSLIIDQYKVQNDQNEALAEFWSCLGLPTST